ncbi:hypothetical protein llap_12799 [Limosa lapponica baueri]|uniref:Rna-directed dna polymerase from mobile element jockey-like n=1 Tax=Limosa lapponica baueri TaxID=1758121 RepID=A0A2I0TSZ5_LIMLA|nr:hypothetical protein llap_12799 [Limosa lapponica baueri]
MKGCGKESQNLSDLNLLGDLKGKKSEKGSLGKNVGLLLNGEGNLVTKDMEKAEAANAFFTSVFTVNIDLQESQAPESRAKVWSKEDLSSEEKHQVIEYRN